MVGKEEEVLLKELDKFMNDYIDEIFALSQQKLVDDGKIDTGFMLKTANVKREFLKKEIVYPAPYAVVVHNGRASGHPMYSGWLHKWVRRKLGITDEKKVKSISYAIAKTIEKRGIEPTPFLRDAAESVAFRNGDIIDFEVTT